MRKFKSLQEVTTDNILEVSHKCCYEICVYPIGEETGLQDAGCLEAFLEDAGIEFISANDDYYTYKLVDTVFNVPYSKVDEYGDGLYDSYLLFDKLEVVEK